jgi:hypothetical protein
VEDHVADTRFNVMWHRHTAQWWPLHPCLPLDQALHLIETDMRLQPIA